MLSILVTIRVCLQQAKAKLKIQHSWLARIARYFAWAVDGGLLGARFNLDLMIEGPGCNAGIRD